MSRSPPLPWSSLPQRRAHRAGCLHPSSSALRPSSLEYEESRSDLKKQGVQWGRILLSRLS
ncbi:hypothetical protein PVAP13_2NG592900 [Panicum virgatum]|uniref:Uncharacterized protein n=1 Tax=Panicum virgatum TaxID=38727 RepID=A0A8T0VU86_PANVG|nr:hypothetical protein PVAP13_2NG592900 [Panicum virgatum]